jgi:hypothetical protein
MQVQANSWYVHYYFFAAHIWNVFKHGEDSAYYYDDHTRSGTNLCFFIRVMVVWAPLVIALHLAAYGAAIAALSYIPIKLFGVGPWKTVAVAAAAVVGVIFGLRWLAGVARRWSRRRYDKQAAARYAQDRERWAEDVPARPAKPYVKRGPSFWEVAREYLKAKKKLICPQVEISYE